MLSPRMTSPRCWPPLSTSGPTTARPRWSSTSSRRRTMGLAPAPVRWRADRARRGDSGAATADRVGGSWRDHRAGRSGWPDGCGGRRAEIRRGRRACGGRGGAAAPGRAQQRRAGRDPRWGSGSGGGGSATRPRSRRRHRRCYAEGWLESAIPTCQGSGRRGADRGARVVEAHVGRNACCAWRFRRLLSSCKVAQIETAARWEVPDWRQHYVPTAQHRGHR